MIYHLMKYSGKHFNIHFALSRNGGPDWIRELSQWELLQEAEWHLVSRTKRSYVNAVKIKPQSAVLQKRERKRVFNWISYPSNYFQFNYASEVCQNHQKDLTRQKPPEFLVIIVIMGVIIGQLRGPRRVSPGFQMSVKSGPFRTDLLARFVALAALVWAI
jgi:hypothetical protein